MARRPRFSGESAARRPSIFVLSWGALASWAIAGCGIALGLDGYELDPTALCADGAKGEGEGDIDCGGPCAPCADGKRCAVKADCASGVCDGGVCSAPACDDEAKNGDESDVDCGAV